MKEKLILGGWRITKEQKKKVQNLSKKEKVSESKIIRNLIDTHK